MKLTLLGRRVVIVLIAILLVSLGVVGYFIGKGLTLLALILMMAWSSWSVRFENPNNE